MLSKFVFIFLAAKYLELSQFGLYGLLVATIGYCLYFLGFDFYVYATREIAKTDRSNWGALFSNQICLFGILYAVALPLMSLLFIYGVIPPSVMGWFFLLVVLEHINQEIGRMLVSISEQLLASWVGFVRQGLWSTGMILLMIFNPKARNLEYVLAAWSAFGVIAIAISVYFISNMGIGGWNKSVDWRWIFRGVKISIYFLVATLALRALFTLDRYLIQFIGNLEAVGAYVLFMSFSAALLAFLDAGIFSFSYPMLISAHATKNAPLFYRNYRQLIYLTVSATFLFAMASLISLPYLLVWLGQEKYLDLQYLFPWILYSIVLYALGMIPHFLLYAQGFDRPIIQSHLLGFVVFILTSWMFSSAHSLLAVPYGLCCAFLVILLWKGFAFYKMTPVHFRSYRIQ